MTDLYVIEGGLSGAKIKAVKHRPVPLTKDMRAAEALRLVMLESLAHTSANVPGVITASNEKSLHQLRVGLRRLDTTLIVYRRVTGDKAVKQLRVRLKVFLKSTARARDLDVFLNMLPAIEMEAADPLQMEVFRSHVDTVRRKAWKKAIRQIETLAFATLLDDIAMLAENAPYKSPNAVKAMRKVLKKTWAQCRARGRGFASHSPRARHHLRIHLKRLSHESDIFAALKPSGEAKRYRNHLSTLRDLLGDQQDLIVAQRSLKTLAPDDRFSISAKTVEDYCERRHRALEKGAKPLWKKFSKKTAYWA